MGYSPWGHKELDMTEQLTHTHSCLPTYVCLFLQIEEKLLIEKLILKRNYAKLCIEYDCK